MKRNESIACCDLTGSASADRRAGECGAARTFLLILVFFFLGVLASAIWFTREKMEPVRPERPALSANTTAVLNHLNSTMEVRLYSVLDPSLPVSFPALASRLEQLVSAYEQAAPGKIKVTRFDALSPANANAALADGLKAFNQDKGEACYLGLTLSLGGQKETLAQLSPDWEQAMEPDLTRAITRLLESVRAAAPPVPAAEAQSAAAAAEEVRTLVPNYATVSVEEGTRLLREAALKDFTAAANEMKAQVDTAQQQLLEAQNGKSEAEQQAALTHLQQVQADGSRKLKAIANKSNAQIGALKQLKATVASGQ